MAIHCNSGTYHANMIGNILLIQQDMVWFHFSGISNVLSLAQVIQHYKVTYNRQNYNSFILRLPNNKAIKFK